MQSSSTPETRLSDELADLSPARLSAARAGVLVLLATALFLAYLTRHSLAVVNTSMQQELGINNEQFGWIISAFSTGYLLCQIPGGWLGQRFGTRWMLAAFAAAWSVMTSLFTLAGSIWSLVTIRLLFGMAQAGLVPNQAQVIKDWFPEQRRATTSSLLMAAMQVGSVASLALTGWVSQSWGWRTIFHVYGALGIAWAVVFAWWFRTYPQEMAWLTGGEAPLVQMDRSETRASSAKIPWEPIFRSRSFWGLAGQAFFKAAGYNFAVTFFPAMLEFAYAVPKEQTGNLAAISMVGLVAGSLIGGWTIDGVQRRTENKRVSRCLVAGISLVLTASVMSAAPLMKTGMGLSLLMGVAALVSGFAQSPPWAAIIDIGGKQTAVVMGFMNCASSLPGIIISPLTGRLMDQIQKTNGDWNIPILLHALFYLLAALCWLAVDPNRTIESVSSDREEPPHAV